MTTQLRSIALQAPDGTRSLESLLATILAPTVAFRDGDRWTQLEDTVTLALAAPADLPEGAAASLNVKVTDVTAAHSALTEAGAASAQDPTTGEHEVRAAVWLAPHLALTVYSSR